MLMKTTRKGPLSLLSPPLFIKQLAWAAAIYIIMLHVNYFIIFIFTLIIVPPWGQACGGENNWCVFLWGFFLSLVCVVALLLSGGQNLQRRLSVAAAGCVFILCNSQSLLSLQSGAAAEEKGKQTSDIPSASLFFQTRLIRETLLPN